MNTARNEKGQFTSTKNWQAVALLLITTLTGAWMLNPYIIKDIDIQSPIVFRNPIHIQWDKYVWMKESEMVSPLVKNVVANEANTVKIVPTPTKPPITSKPAPEPNTELQKANVQIIDEVWGEQANMGRRLAYCESSYGTNIENTQSSARGIFQFIKATWISTRQAMNRDASLALRFDPRENIETAHYLYMRDGFRHWYPSEACVNNGSH